MIEFLTPLVGPAKLEGKPRALDGQPGIAALPLDRLQLLAEHTRELLIFSKPENTRVRVPTLGAYFLNKALTFNKRQATTAGSNPKRAKDLVYIRDLMAAGKEVRDAIRADLSDIVKTEKRAVRFAAGRVEGVIQPGGASPDLKEAARQLLEREQAEEESYWEQDLRANLTQAAQMLAQPKQKRLRRS